MKINLQNIKLHRILESAKAIFFPSTDENFMPKEITVNENNIILDEPKVMSEKERNDYLNEYNKLANSNDVSIMMLPHPKRLLTFMDKLTKAHFPEKINQLIDEWKAPTFEIIYNLIKGDTYLTNQIQNNGIGTFDAHVIGYSYTRANGKMFTVRDSHNTLLQETDIGSDTPCHYIKLPFKAIFLEFGQCRNNTLSVHHKESGKHVAEGCYILEYEGSFNKFGVESTRLLSFLFVGSPFDKNNPIDDATYSFHLYIFDENDSLSETLSKNLELEGRGNLTHHSIHPKFKKDINELAAHAVKILLYINSEGAQLEDDFTYSNIEQLIKNLGPKKQAKYNRKLDRAYDKILLGSETSNFTGEASLDKKLKSAHWRRGHFRNQPFGEKLLQRKLIWIKPTLVTGIKEPIIKNYIVI